jgi:uncharacterized membrane protein (UPF0127 family)
MTPPSAPDMSAIRTVRNTVTGAVLLDRARLCSSFWSKFRGLMFRRALPDGEGLIFVYGRESKMNASIHMLFMAFPIATVWLDKDYRVVDKTLAKPWRLAYAPRVPAQYVIEARPGLLERVTVGDHLTF